MSSIMLWGDGQSSFSRCRTTTRYELWQPFLCLARQKGEAVKEGGLSVTLVTCAPHEKLVGVSLQHLYVGRARGGSCRVGHLVYGMEH